MKSTHLASRIRTGLLLAALTGLLAACGDKAEEPIAENTVDQAPAEAVAPAADGRGLAYVSNQDGGVTVIDLNTMETVRSIDTKAGGPRGIGITPDGKTL